MIAPEPPAAETSDDASSQEKAKVVKRDESTKGASEKAAETSKAEAAEEAKASDSKDSKSED